MKILVIEDDPNKAQQIITFLKEDLNSSEIIYKKSYQSGLKELYENSFDLVLLDMSLPTYDITPGEDAYKFRHIAGYDILSELKRKRKTSKVIIMTQFERFGEGKQYISLSNLKMTLRKEFPNNYLVTISYHPGRTTWKEELINYINKIKI
jgi:DNA-binding NarL/FixJ family response regulator